MMDIAGFHTPRRVLRAEMGLPGRLELLEVPQQAGARPLVLVLSYWGLDRPRSLPPNVALVGPVEDYSAKASGRRLPEPVRVWLDGGQGRTVYVSFGTSGEANPQLFRLLLQCMAKLQQEGFRFLWDTDWAAVEPRANSESDGRLALPRNVFFAPRVDQLGVLA